VEHALAYKISLLLSESLTDAASFAVMERLRLPAAFTFDRHFAQYGFTVLVAQ